MEISLKPCPFCGGSAWTEEYPAKDGPSTFSAYCERCGAETSLSYKSRGEAVEAWNARTPPSDWREARELLDATFQPDSGNLEAAYLVGLADGKAEARGTCHDAFTRFDAWTCSAAKAWNTRAEPRACATCYYYQTTHERGRRTERKACFGEHLHAAVGGLDWEDEAECWADMAPSDHCTNWTPRD